jgi:replicative DNA helicase
MNTMRNNDGASALAERHPPMNLEAERSFLGSCLLDQRAIDDGAEILSGPEDFYRSVHEEIWRSMLELRESGKPVDPVTVADHLIGKGRFAAMGGDEFLTELVTAVPHAANASYYAGIIREKAIARRLLDAATETIREVYSLQKTASELVCCAEERVFSVGESEIGSSFGAIAILDETMARLSVRQDGITPGLETGYRKIDIMTGGLQPSTMTILAARPSQGKTALAMEIARHVAVSEPVLFVSLEMNRRELGDRLLSSHSGVAGSLIRDAHMLQDRHLEAIRCAAPRVARLKLWVDDAAQRTVSQIAAQARRMKRRDRLGLVVVDYLGLIDGQRQRGESRQEEVARVSRGLKAAAKHLAVPFLVLCQLNRQSEHREGRRPELADLRESGQIEQDADLVLMLHRPEFYDPNEQPGIAEVLVRKNRNGATGIVRLLFRKECTAFDSIAV